MSDPAQSPEQRELALVGKVEMRIALTDTDAKLESILKTYLAPLLLKLASEHQSVRNKVVSICQHINKRVQPQSIQLPVAALVKQFKEQQSSLIRHFDLLYIQQGVVRLAKTEKAQLLPIVISGIAKADNHGPQIFHLLLRLLDSFIFPARGSKEDLEMRSKHEISDEDATFLSSYLGKFILFIPQKGSSTTCPGLNPDEYAFFTLQGKEDTWSPAAGGLNLMQTKTLAAKLLATGLFNDTERFFPALFASADPASSISDVGEDMLKRALPAADLEDESTVQRLFDLYFGKESAPRVRAPLGLKILGLLGKSTRSTNFTNEIAKIVDDGVAAPKMDGEDVLMSNGPTQSTNIGREASKLRAAVFTYVNFVARHGNHGTLHAVALQIVGRLRDFVEDQGWPKPGQSEDLVSRGYAYEVMGLLAKAGPRSLLIEDDRPSMDLLRWLFDSLARDSSSNAIIVSVEESLSTVLSAFARLDLAKHEQEVLEDLLIDQMAQSADLAGNKRLRSTRYVAVRFANRCLPYSSVKARWVDVLAMGATNDRPEVREEGERGLSPYWYRMLNGQTVGTEDQLPPIPSFEPVIKQFFIDQAPMVKIDSQKLVLHLLEQLATSFPFISVFARRILFQQALQKANITLDLDSEWERKLDIAIESDPAARDAVKSYMREVMDRTPEMLDILFCALFECVTAKLASTENHLVEFLALAPQSLVQREVSRAGSLLPTLRSNDHARRMTAAHAFGILASHPSNSGNSTAVLQLLEIMQSWSSSVGTSLSSVHGAVVALGFYFSRTVQRSQKTPDGEAYQKYIASLFDIFQSSKDDTLQEASYIALGQMCMFKCLTTDLVNRHSKFRSISDKLYEKSKNGNEAAILCLGELTMILPEDDTEDSELSHTGELLHKLHEIRQSEVHFTVGEAFSYLACGWNSAALATKLDTDGPAPSTPIRTQTFTKLLDRVLSDCVNTKPSLKKAAVMWLLCLVQFCGGLPELQTRLTDCQKAFRRCLTDRDELVQETASRGLGLVYEKGDRNLKDDLVRDLVSSFSSDKQQLAGNVSAETQLFEPGALPTGDGSVSTYKDIMSLASEVGDSSLVYKFMSMASSNAIWSSRAAFGRFGLSRVLSDSSVDGYLASNPKLYPKLFRYRFDPNGGVQRSMNEIWNALVPNSAATIDQHFDAIIEDLLNSILGKEWRVRQACCAAIADLVQGRPLEKYEKYLERIWTQCFKVLDDIKESVRAAASSLARTLTGVITRALEADHSATKNASEMLKHVLPFLLSPSGMESSAQDVQMFAVQTLLEIIKKANGATIRPFIPELIERLIGLLSSLEPEAVNYIHMNASKYNLTEQKIDDMRLSSVRSSPIMEAIERCLDFLDEETMKTLQPRLESALKSAMGLPSKVGSSRVLVSLSTRRMVLFQPYADEALKWIEKLVIDRNETVSSSYAAAAGYVARGASDKQLTRLINFAKRLYFESEGDREAVTPRRSIAAGELMFAFAKQASDKFNSFATAVLPFVFVAKHDPHDQVKEQFQETWNESVGGSRAVNLYLEEILKLCATHLDSPQWALKHTAARAVADAVVVISASDGEMSAATGSSMWPAIEKALSGKTWDGKEVVLSAFVKFVEAAKPFYVQQKDVRDAIVKISIREAKRQNSAYRQHSVKALAGVARARTDVDMSDQVWDAVSPVLQESGSDAMEVDGEQQSHKAEELKEATLARAVEALFAAINPSVSTGETLNRQFSRAIGQVVAVPAKTPSIWRSIYSGLAGVFDRMREHGQDLGAQSAPEQDLQSLLFSAAVGSEAVRLSRADAICAMAKASTWLAQTTDVQVRALIADEVAPVVRDRLKSARLAKPHVPGG